MLYCICGMTASGKDTILNNLIKTIPNLHYCISHTTRPMRENEEQDVQYHFIDEYYFNDMVSNGDFIEMRKYKTTEGYWYYGLAKDELKNGDNIVIVDIAGLQEIIHTLGTDNVISFYIEVDNKMKLERSLSREPNINNTGVEEICRRLLDDLSKFRDAKNICNYTIQNNTITDLQECSNFIKSVIERSYNV